MGLFSFLKKKEEKAVIAFADLTHWLDDFLDKKQLKQRLEEFKEAVKKEISELNKHLEELANSELMNPNIPDRAKHMMVGNREQYILKMKSFLENINIPDDYNAMGYFASKFSEEIDKLSEKTQRNYLVLNEFFGKEITKIATKVKKIEDKSIKFRKELEKENLDIVNDVKVKLKELYDELGKKKELLLNKQNYEQLIKELEEKEKKIIERLDKLKESQDFKGFKDLHEKKQGIENKIECIKKELKSDFSSLERALKKYTHNTPDEKIVLGYLKEASEELLRDSEIKIADMISELREKLPELDLKEKKEISTLETINKLSKEYLKKAKEEIENLKEEITNLNKQLKGTVISLNISEQQTFLREAKKKIEEKKQSLESIEKELGRINPNLLREKIKEKVKELADVVFEGEKFLKK